MKSSPTGIEIIERAIHLLRAQPSSVWMVQFAGSIPLLLAGLFSFLDAVSETHSTASLGAESLVCAACLIWLNVCRSRFAQYLLASLSGEGSGSWKQAFSPVYLALQSAKLVIEPAALIAGIPWPRTVAFFRTTPLVHGPGSFSHARRLAGLWPRQNWSIVALSSLWGFVLFINFASAIVIAPYLIKMFSGMENGFTRSQGNPITAVTLGIALALSWFTLDPLFQAIYTVRFFLGEARSTGADLRAAIARLAVLMIFAIPLQHSALAAGPGVTGAQLHDGVRSALAQPSYAWHRRIEAPSHDDLLTRTALNVRATLGWMVRGIRHLFDRLFHQDSPNSPDGKRKSHGLSGSWVLMILFLVLAGIAGFTVVRLRSSAGLKLSHPTTTVALTPDLNSETITASDLPEERWRELASQCFARGEYRAALRAIYLANLSFLARRELLTISRSKSNLDYARELNRRARNANLNRAFTANMRSFERGWYGLHPVAAGQIEEFEATFEEMKAHAGN